MNVGLEGVWQGTTMLPQLFTIVNVHTHLGMYVVDSL